MPEILIHHGDEKTTLTAEKNMTLLDFLKKNEFSVESPCNGRGTCGKCRVRINRGAPAYTKHEKKHLTDLDVQNQIHLACMCRITDDMEITLLSESRKAAIQTDHNLTEIVGTPVIKKHALSLSAPSLSDQVCDEARLFRDGLNTESCAEYPFSRLPLKVLEHMPDTFRQNAFHITAITLLEEITGVESGDTSHILYGVAFDVGTTTLAAYLYDLSDKKQLMVSSSLNPQKKFGADVISRIDYASQDPSRREEMATLIHEALSLLIRKLCSDTGISPDDIYLATLVGNTTMIHLFLGLPAIHIATAPFIPVTLSGQLLDPEEVCLPINPAGRIVVLPSVSAYIGSDTVSAVLSTAMHTKDTLSLLVDIGTNGEIVLGNASGLFACSTAAGPAFEGANIRCGMGGLEGAINEVRILPNGTLKISTIGDGAPIGICGSGLIDAMACMLQTGVLDETGYIVSAGELPEAIHDYRDRLIEINGQTAFVLSSAANTSACENIVITQKDIREVQNAKAAIAAGIQVLVKEAGYQMGDIDAVYLAGGFGSTIRIESALRVGLLPKELRGNIHAVGNAAGAGAIHALLSKESLLQSNTIAKKVTYLELSSNPDFVQAYTDNMFFDTIFDTMD